MSENYVFDFRFVFNDYLGSTTVVAALPNVAKQAFKAIEALFTLRLTVLARAVDAQALDFLDWFLLNIEI